MSDNSSDDDEVESTPGQVNPPSLEEAKLRHAWQVHLTKHQKNILVLLLITIFCLIIVDIIAKYLDPQSRSYLDDVSKIIIPIFTLLLGIGSNGKEN